MESRERITLTHTRPNPLIQSWLEELHAEAKLKKSKLESMLNEALISLSKYPLPLQSGAQCAILKGFDKRLCMFLDKRLEFYNSRKKMPTSTVSETEVMQRNDQKLPSTSKDLNSSPEILSHTMKLTSQVDLTEPETSTSSQNDNSQLCTYEPVTPKSKSYIVYKPPYRSGGYAILIALLEQLNNNQGVSLDKETLIVVAQKYCDTSFTVTTPDSLYTAWSNMEQLIIKGLVNRGKGKRIKYSLTNEGYLVAIDLLKSVQELPYTNDTISNEDSSRKNQLLEKGHDSLDEYCNSSKGFTLSNGQSASNTGNSPSNVIEMAPQSFNIILLIDKNEISGVKRNTKHNITQFLKYTSILHESRSLKVGDYTWIARNKDNKNQELVLPYIIERKRINDLAASIKDGRYHEQKFRLKRCGIENVIYMIETNGTHMRPGLPLRSLKQALTNTKVTDGFKVHIHKTAANSARFLATITKRLTVKYTDTYLKGWDAMPDETKLMTFNYFNRKSIKNKPLTITETFIKMLLQMKGISVEKAIAIINHYDTPYSLINAYKNVNQKQGELLLSKLKYGEMNRNIGPVISKNIYRLFTK